MAASRSKASGFELTGKAKRTVGEAESGAGADMQPRRVVKDSVIGIRAYEDQAEWLRTAAFMERRSQADIIRDALDEYIERHGGQGFD